jgi:SSS family solute:Na+ symporter|tara:strand:- start:35 stop:340 length:306 start_codon:yes stop_codon:yes gene_type:complete
MLAGFFTKIIIAAAAKVALLVGLTFFVSTTFIFPVGIHIVHIWGIEFLVNMFVMFAISYFYLQSRDRRDAQPRLVDLEVWKYTRPFSIALCVLTVSIYAAL